MGSLYFLNRGVKCFLCVIDVLTKYAWVKPSKDKKCKADFYGFIEIVNKSERKPINYGLINEDDCTISLCKNVQVIMIF